MHDKLFSDLTFTQQLEFSKRLSQGLPFPHSILNKMLQDMNPTLVNCRVKGAGWGYLQPKDFFILGGKLAIWWRKLGYNDE